MMMYISILTGTILGYGVAAWLLGPNETRTALGGRMVLALAGGLAGWWGAAASESHAIPWADDIVQVRSVAEFDTLLERSSQEAVLVEFYADWCPSCRAGAEELQKLAKEGHRVAVVNMESQPQLAARYAVQAVPTVLILRAGKAHGPIPGAFMADDLRVLLKTL